MFRRTKRYHSYHKDPINSLLVPPSTNKGGGIKLLLWRAFAFSFLGFSALLGFTTGVIVEYYTHLPSLEPLDYDSMNYWGVGTKIYDITDTPIAEFTIEQRKLVPLDKCPKDLIDAIIATEDKSFYTHCGIDFSGVARATIVNIRSFKFKEGASTITQQLARNLFLTTEKNFHRKIQELLLAIKIEHQYIKDEILERYLNKIYLGHGLYGVESASFHYFGKSVSELNLAECAMLAGLPKAPTSYSPITYPQRAQERQETVLDRMQDAGYITKREYEDAKKQFSEEIKTISKKPKTAYKGLMLNKAPYFIEYIRQILDSDYGGDAVYKGGLEVYTTLDMKLQQYATEALTNGLTKLNQGKTGRRKIEGALIAINPNNGYIKAMVGGSGFVEANQFNRVINGRRQPGSAFKPFIYTAALDNGFTTSSILPDQPVIYKNPNGTIWQPQNYEGTFHGNVTLRKALEQSLNVATIKLLEEIRPYQAIRYARSMGITSPLPNDLSLALGTCDVSPLEMARAYTCFANGGMLVSPLYIRMIKDFRGKLIQEYLPHSEQVIKPEIAYLITNLLEGAVRRGTAATAIGKRIFSPVAGKTGTTDNWVDAWFIGYTTELVVACWIGYDKGRISLGEGKSGSVVAAPIWADFMERVLVEMEPKKFPVPQNIVWLTIDPTTSLLATDLCPSSTKECFIAGSEPSKLCDQHQGDLLPDELPQGPPSPLGDEGEDKIMLDE